MSSIAPRVSIIMATYNYSQVLPFSIRSALLQTMGDFELLVVGDGCSDDSAAVVGAIDDPRVRWIGLANNSGHQSGPNNHGLIEARGEIIAYLGHDDLWFRDHLASLVDAIDGGADVAWSVARWVTPDPSDDPLYLLPAYRAGAWIPPSALAHRRAVTERIGGWTDYRQLAEDPEVDLLRRADCAGFRFAFVPQLTLVKFPATLRRSVYRDRPNHEQAAWSRRIDEEPDLASTELMAIAINRLSARPFYRDLLAHFWSETRQRLRRRLNPRPRTALAPGAAIDGRKEYKGLQPPKGLNVGGPDQ